MTLLRNEPNFSRLGRYPPVPVGPPRDTYGRKSSVSNCCHACGSCRSERARLGRGPGHASIASFAEPQRCHLKLSNTSSNWRETDLRTERRYRSDCGEAALCYKAK